jgi:hypothetical protein
VVEKALLTLAFGCCRAGLAQSQNPTAKAILEIRNEKELESCPEQFH